MIISIIYNIGLFTIGALSGSILFILMSELYEIQKGRRILPQMFVCCNIIRGEAVRGAGRGWLGALVVAGPK